MALNFPSAPSANATYTFNDKTWTYNGNAWALSTSTLNTGIVSEGSNLYFTNARARASITVSGSGTYDPNTGAITISQSSNYGDSNVALLGYATNANVALKANTADLKTANVAELTNLYFTNARARTAISVTGSGSYDNATGIITITGGVSSVNGQTGATSGFATTANSLSQFASTTSAQLATLISDETGSGSLVFSTTPTLVTPVLGLATGTSVMLSANVGAAAGNVSGNFTAGNFQTAGNVNSASELVTGSLTAGTLQTSGNVNSNNLRVVTASSLGTVQSGTWNGSSISTTYTDAKVTSVNGSTGAVTGLATTAGTLAQFGATTSSQLAGVISDETGTGALVFATSPTLVTPALGTPASGNLTNCTFPTLNQSTTGSAATLTTSRNINGVAFNGSIDITVTAAAGTLTGSSLNATVTGSSLTSVGTITSGTWNGSSISTTYTDAKIVSVSGTAPITASTTTGAVTVGLSTSGVSATTYGGATAIPSFVVDQYGRITSASNVAVAAGVSASRALAFSLVFGS